MKRVKFVLLGVLACVSISTLVSAAPLSPMNTTGDGSDRRFVLGVETDFVLDRELDIADSQLEYQAAYLKGSYIANNQFEIYALAGAMQLDVDFNAINTGYETDLGWLIGAGATFRALSLSDGLFNLDLDAKYRYSVQTVDRIRVAGFPFQATGDVTFQDWQIGAVVSTEINGIQPYVGVKYNQLDITDVDLFIDREGDAQVGVVIGLRANATENLAFNVEGRFIDEEAISGGFSLKF